MSVDSEHQRPESLFPFLATAFAVLALLVVYGWVITKLLAGWTERGQFGDMFGAANTFFSGLAFAALAYTLYLQRKELSLQRLELALTRSELAKQSEAQTQQASTALRAARISALGSLFEAYSQLVSSGNHQFVGHGDAWPNELRRVRDDLNALLNEGA